MPGSANTFTHQYQSHGFVGAPAIQVFAFIDDHLRLSSHMSESSWMMGGGRMTTEFDEGRGQNVGSRIRLSGKVFGIKLEVDEIVTERNPPHRKVWETTGEPKLLVIGQYQMGFELTPQDNGSMLRVFIAYALPKSIMGHWLGRVFGKIYAKWCTQEMVSSAVNHFAATTGSKPKGI